MKVRCVSLLGADGRADKRSGWVKLGEVYHVLSILIEPEQTMLRLLGDQSVPALYEPKMFEVVSSIVPSVWTIASPNPGYLSIGPAAWSRPGFWEEYFDDNAEAIATFENERRNIVALDP